jgi:hypothetical protein
MRSERNRDARDEIANHPFGLVSRWREAIGVRAEGYTVSENRDGKMVNVVGDAIGATSDEGAGSGGSAERDGTTGGCTKCEERRGARRLDDRVHVIEKRGIKRDAIHLALKRHETRRIENDRHITGRVRIAGKKEAHLDLRRRVANSHPQHEAVELRLGERISPGEVLRVLRCDDEEWIRQRMRHAVDGDLLLIHSFEQSRLRSWAGTIDFVSQKNIREDWSVSEDELARVLVVDGYTDDVAWKQIARELDPSKISSHGASECACEGRLANAGHVFDEEVTSTDERDERKLDGFLFSLECAFDSATQGLNERKLFEEQGRGRRHDDHDSTVVRGGVRYEFLPR